MSQVNVEFVKAAYEAFASGGLDRWMEQFAEDVDYRADDIGPIRGREALRAWLQDWIDTFDEFWFEPVELIDTGKDAVVAGERYGGRAKGSTATMATTIAVVFTARDGKIARGREYATREQALKAAGLSDKPADHVEDRPTAE
jgi:ketosteroid isomerase-like protein